MASSFAAQLADALETSWPAMARPNQLPPPGHWWQIWFPNCLDERNYRPGELRLRLE